MSKIEIDRRRIERLLADLLVPIKAHFEAGPQTRARTLEVLNALAASVAVVLTDQASLDFFNEALCNHLPEELKGP